MSQSPCTSITLTAEEEAALLLRVGVKTAHPYAAGSHCDACNKVLEDGEVALRGYASGYELGLCRKCASHVNTPSEIDRAERAGHKVHAKPVLYTKEGANKARHALPGSEWDY